MPAIKPATVRADELPDVLSAPDLAAFERVDVRTVRAALDAGKIPGAFRRGRSWRIVKATYMDALETPKHVGADSEGTDASADMPGRTRP